MPRVYLSVPHMGGSEERYVREAFASNWLSTVGPNLDAFEREFAALAGRPALALASGTAAIHLGLRLLGVGPGDEVLVSDLTFVASVNPIRYLGATPVLVDSDRDTWMMSPALLAEALEDRARRRRPPRAAVVVHLYGQCADMDPILDACRRHDVPVLEDAAEALGALYRGQRAGSLGDLGAFSFNGNKILTTTGGGMLVARRPEWIDRARFWSTQARDPGLAYHHTDVGYNYRMSNVLAGIGRGQLEVLDERVRQRRAVAFRYRDAFADLPGLSLMPQAPYGLHTNWLSCFLVDRDALGASRDDIVRALAERGVEARPVWKPMHLQGLYRECRCFGGSVAADLFERGLCLPSSSNLSADDQALVIEIVRRVARHRRMVAGGCASVS
jgi:pyridoxal phosphate-dependent aminotransferase EpsN